MVLDLPEFKGLLNVLDEARLVFRRSIRFTFVGSSHKLSIVGFTAGLKWKLTLRFITDMSWIFRFLLGSYILFIMRKLVLEL